MPDRLNSLLRLGTLFRTNRRQRQRISRFEKLERRDLLAAAVWHNVVFPLDVTGDQPARVSAIDALQVINWLNDQSKPRTLPRQTEQPVSGPFVDTNCDGRVSALDALLVINHLNLVGAGIVGGFMSDGGRYAGSACSPQLVEGQGFFTELDRVLKLPEDRKALRIGFESPAFDTSSVNQVRDAFEIVVTDRQGIPVIPPIHSNRPAVFNWTEGFDPIHAQGLWSDTDGAEGVTSITLDLSHLEAGAEIRASMRLVNNDSDNNTSVVIRGYEFVELPSSLPPGGEGMAESPLASSRTFDFRRLSDLTGQFEVDYGRTSLSADRLQLVSQAELTNRGNSAILGPMIAVFENFSDPNVFMVRPDGFLQDGRPFIDLTGRMNGSALASGQSLSGPEIRFRNDSGQRFQYQLSIYGRVNSGPAGFSSQPVTSIEAGKRYVYDAYARPTLDSPLSYKMVSGPEGMTVDQQSGQVRWQSQTSDVGSHRITLRATDEFGLSTEQSFALQVLEVLPNRPPVFVSNPGTEAVAAGAFDVITLPTGSMPAGLAVANFGILGGASSINELSLVAINQGSQTLSLIPGLGRDGAGREIYGPLQTLSVGEPPRQNELLRGVVDIDLGLPPLGNTTYDRNRIMGMIHGDFNGDGILDVATSIVYQYRSLAVVDHFERYISITLGNGDGTFQPATHLAVPGLGTTADSSVGVVSLHTADFDGDGRLDILTLDTRNNVLLFYRGLGDGTFEAAQSQPTVTPLLSYKVYDVDGDGEMDLVAHHSNQSEFGWLRGRGNGTFEDYVPITSHTGRTANSTYAVGDLNGDGIPDFVSGNNDTFRLNVYLGDGDGSFTRGVDLLQLQSGATSEFNTRWSTSVAIADFNGNGFADILFATEYSSIGGGGGLTLYAGDGSGENFTWNAAHDDNVAQWPTNALGNAEPIDINGDGHLDLVFSASEFGGLGPVITVAINRGNGVFDTDFWVDTNLGTHPRPSNLNNALGVLVGDFNNDGMVDLLTARGGRQNLNNQFSSVSLMLADTPTTFRAARDNRTQDLRFTPHGSVSFVEYADFNNDGILDMWGPYFQNPSFTSLGKGDGTFQPAITATPWIGNEGLGKGFVADLDLDGNLDIVWFGAGGVQGGPQGRYLAALGNGDGSFQITFAQTGKNTPSGYAPIVIKPADFDGDGYMDFVAITGLNTIEIMRNVPEVPGTFTRSFSVPFGASSLRPSIAAGDFDGDGIPDVIAVREQASRIHDLLFYKGIGDGTLAEPVVFPFAPDTSGFHFPKHIAVGDLNGDGSLDFVINASYNRSAVVLGGGDGTFQPPSVYRTGTFSGDQGGLHLIDLDGDGNLDLVSIDDNHSTPRTIEVRLGIGDGTFGPAQIWGTAQGTGWLAFGDLDNDGRLDIGINGTIQWSGVTTFLGARDGLSGVLTTDINGDGLTDILAINHDNSHVKRLINDGRGNFNRLQDLLVGAGPVALLSGDFNGNGRTDFLTINRSSRSISVMLADGLGGYERTDEPVGRLPVAGVFGKVTGGEHDDLLVIDAQQSALFVLTQNGSGAFTESALIPLGDKPSSIAVGDVDGDGGADVIISLAETNRLMILRSLGNGQFADPTYVNLPAKPGKISAGDLNGDGLLDLAVTFPETGEVALLFGMGQSRFTQPQRIRVGSQPDSILMADANGDGLLDILVTNAGDNTASVILNRFDPNQLYRYDALAIDPDDDPVTYSILEGPGGMILDAVTGEIRWAPMGDQIGLQRVVLEANDGRGGRATQEFSISVEAARTNSAPVITTLPSSVVSAEHAFATTVSATDPDGDRLRYRLVEGPEGASIDPVTGQIDWDPRGAAMQMNREVFASGSIQLPHTAAQNIASLTVEGWFRFAKTDGNQVLIDKALNWATPGFFTLRYFTGNLQFLIGDGTAAGVETLSVARALPTEEWIHLSATFDDTNGEMALFVNGAQVASRTTTKRIGVPAGNIPLWVGQEVYPFHGDVYGFRMWDTVRPASQIIDGMHQQLPAVTPHLVVDLRFNEGDSLSVINHVDHNHRGLISGTVVPKRIVGMAPIQPAQFTVSVEDGKGGFDLQSFSVTVAPKLPGSVTGTLFSDDNRDGSRQAGEALLAGWTVFIDHNNNGYRDADEPFAVTNASGVYQFNQLLQSDYSIAVEPRAGFAVPAARNVSVVSQQVTTGDMAAEPLLPGQVRGRLTQANPSQPLAHQQVFADLNRNGLWDDGGPFSTTDAEGRFAIGGLAAGSYSLRVRTQPAWQVTEPATSVHDVVLASHDLLDDLDFVLRPSNSIAAAMPQIVTRPPQHAQVRQTYRYAVAAISHDGRPIAYSLSLAPEGMAIDARSGQIAWTPTGRQTGVQQVIVRAATDNSHVDLQAFFIEVAPANSAPIVTSTPASPASVGRLWIYQVMAQDAEQTEFAYSLSVAPTGAMIDTDEGIVRWTPLASQTGAHAFTILVSDGTGGISHHSFTLDVISDAPSTLPFAIRPPRADASLLTQYLSRVSGVDSTGQDLAIELVSGPAGLTLDARGFIQWSPTMAQLGLQTVTVRFTSLSGSSEEHQYTIHVRQTIGNSAPQIQSAPSSLLAVAGQLYAYDMVVTDTDNDALSFELVTAPPGMSIHPQSGTLRWLPTLDQLGQSTVTIRVTDPQGGSDTQSFTLTTRRLGGPPLIQSVPPTQAAVGIGYLHSVLAIDAENDPLTFSLIEAPAGMTIDSRTGEIAWTPTAEQLGQQSVFIAVSDASGNRSTQGFSVEVAVGLPNRPPVISSQPNLFASVGENYTTTLQATDPEGTMVTYSLGRGPEGMTVEPDTGAVSWIPAAGQAGRVIVTLVATDAEGGASVQSFEIDVLGVNNPPQIISTPPLFAWARGLFQYDVIARDADRDPIRFEFISSVPDGLSIDALGRIRWQTQAGDVGNYSVTVRASDPRGGEATQQIDFEVRADNLPPKVTVLPRGGGWPWDGPIVVFVSAVDNVGVVDVELRVNGQIVPLDANRNARLSFDDWGPGVLNMVATARDAAGNLGTGTATSFYRDPEVDYESGEGLPIASIPTLGENGTVYGMVQIVGTAIGGTAAATGFKEYRLSYARLDQLQFTEFVHSTTPVSDGLLGVWDTTLLENDSYVLRLEVVSEAGNTSVHETTVGVSGNLKLGNFRLSFEDLTIPVAGIPITIVRTYDTLRADRDGDFGHGWRLEYRNTDLRVSLPKSGLEDLGIYTPFRSGTKIYLTLPGGQRVGWTFTPEMRVLPGWAKGNDLVMASPRYTPDRGNTATLSAGSGWLTVNQFGELYATGGMPWNPASPDFGGGFTVTLGDGTRYFIDGTTGLLQTVSDRFGNSLTFSDQGVQSVLDGSGVSFQRDRHGRITSVIDPAGNVIRYEYSSAGDLTGVIDREGHQTRMIYRSDRAHYLHEIIDPLGRKAARIDYDPDGRMSGISSGENRGVSLTYDPPNDLVSSTDALGNVTLRGYDADGNITSITDPLGRTTQWKFDAIGQVTEILSADGARTIIQRDSFGRETSRTSPLGEVTRYTYGAAGKLTGMTDALGNSWTYELDDRGNRIREIDPLGNTTIRSYDSRGRITSLVDPDGYLNEFSYSSNGWMNSILYADGTVQTLDYDALGRVIKTEVVREGMTAPIAVQLSYDSNGRPVAHTDALGNTSFSSFTAIGDLYRTQDATGRSMTFGYDATGLRTSVQLDEETSVLYQYDDNGAFIGQTLPGGNRFSNVLDAAGQAVAVILPDLTPEDDSDNPRSLMSYDAVGRLISRQTSNGQEMSFEYDLNGRPIASSHDGNESTSVYDAAGRLVHRREATGNEQFYEYDAAGRLVSVTTWQGTSTMSYDRRGNLIAIQDPLGRTKQFEYDALSRRIAVVEADGDRYEFEYNVFNKVTLQRDPAGRETRYEYDAAGRQTAVITPAGAITRYEYDAAGRLLKVTRPGDLTIEFTYDSQGRLQSKQFADGTIVEIAYGPDGQVASWTSGGESLQKSYDALGRLIQKRQPNGETLDYEYDAVGRIRTVATNLGTTTYEYDEFNRLRRASDSHTGSVEYGYDSVGRLISKQFGNGLTEAYVYSTNGLLLQKNLHNSEDLILDQMDYEYDSFGRVTRQSRADGTQRRFEYNLQDRLTKETYKDANGVESFIAYTYDNVGNRLTMVTDQGITVYEYDADDRLLKATSSLSTVHYSYDMAGRRIAEDDGVTRKEYVWAAEDRLTEVRIITAEGTRTIRYVHDPSGNRISRTENGLTTHYLVDEFLFGRSVVLEERPENGAATRFLPGLGREASAQNGDISYFSTDSRSSPLTSSDSNGQVNHRFDWTAFGLPQTEITSGIPGYTGEQWDSAAELLHLRAREYHPATGQFLTSDPFPATKEISESIHRYAYAHQSPTMFTDPSGLSLLMELSTVGKIMGQLALISGSFGLGYQMAGTSYKWDGLTILGGTSKSGVSVGIGLGVTALVNTRFDKSINQSIETFAMHLLAFESLSISLKNPVPDSVMNNPNLVFAGGLLQVTIGPLNPYYLSFFASLLPIDFSVSSTEMFGPGYTAFALTGPYLSVGAGLSGGIGAIFVVSAVQSAIAGKIDGATISTTFGGSATIQGFSFGYSLLNTGLTLKPSRGAQLLVGLSVGWSMESTSGQPSANP